MSSTPPEPPGSGSGASPVPPPGADGPAEPPQPGGGYAPPSAPNYGGPPPSSPPPAGYGPPPSDPPAGYGPPPTFGTPPSGYGTPPSGYGTPPSGYGTPPSGYGSMPPDWGGSATPGRGYGGYGPPGAGDNYADWGKRVLSGLIDYVGPSLVAGIVAAAAPRIGWIFYIAALAWGLYNAYLAGSTGQSFGKKVVGTRLLGEQTGQPIGGGMGIARYFVHIVDALPCYLGYLWPLWDKKRQTFADKILKTVVVTT